MNPYIHYDRLEDARESRQEYEYALDELIREKADELSEKWPEELSQFADKSLDIGQIIHTDFAQDAYAKMVDEICWQEANMYLRGSER